MPPLETIQPVTGTYDTCRCVITHYNSRVGMHVAYLVEPLVLLLAVLEIGSNEKLYRVISQLLFGTDNDLAVVTGSNSGLPPHLRRGWVKVQRTHFTLHKVYLITGALRLYLAQKVNFIYGICELNDKSNSFAYGCVCF